MRPALPALLLVAGCAAPNAPGPAEQARPAAATAGTPVPPPPPVSAGNPAIGGIAPPVSAALADDFALPGLAQWNGAVTAAQAAPALRGAGPFTVFAPNDEAWGRLQPGTSTALLKPENHAALVKLVDLHIVAGALTGMELMRRAVAGGGQATLTTVAGEPLTLSLTAGILTLTDGGGNKSYVAIADVRAANGVMHVVNGVLVPRLP